MDEASFALEEQKTVSPVVYKDCEIPFRLRRLQYVDFKNDYAHGLQEMCTRQDRVRLQTPTLDAKRAQKLWRRRPLIPNHRLC